MSIFVNHLVAGDQVMEIGEGRRAIVDRTPRDGRRMVSVIPDGTKTPRYVDVMMLRYITPGTKVAEDFAPVTGEPPPMEAPLPRRPPVPVAAAAADPAGPVATLEKAIEANAARMKDMEKEFHALRLENDRYVAALAALKT